MLEVKHVTKCFGGVKALNGVDLVLGTEKITGILGPNGAGKSTLINAITGFFPCTTGQILWNGEDISRLAPHEIARRGIVRTFQIPKYFNGISVTDHLNIADAARRKQEKSGSSSWRRELATQLLENAGFGRALHSDMPIEEVGLSYWQLKVLQAATVICRGGEMLFLDEPVGGLSKAEAEELAKAVRFVTENGVRVCIVEHRIGWILGLAERTVVLEQGRVIAEGTPEEIRTNQRVIDCYLGEADND